MYDNCPIGTQVHIYDSDKDEPLGKPETIRIADTDIKWDPTDDNDENPFNDAKPTIEADSELSIAVGGGQLRQRYYRAFAVSRQCGYLA